MLSLALIALSCFLNVQTKEATEIDLPFSSHGIVIALSNEELWSSFDVSLHKELSQIRCKITIILDILQALAVYQPVILTKKSYCSLQLLVLLANYARTQDKNLFNTYNRVLEITEPYLNAFRFDDQSIGDFNTLLEQVKINIDTIRLVSEGKRPKTFSLDFKDFNRFFGFRLILAAYYNFQPHEWLIKDIGSNLVLLAPQAFYEFYGNDDKNCGLAISTMPDLSAITLEDIAKEVLLPETNIVNALVKCFIPLNQYADTSSSFDVEIPQWTIILTGHGYRGGPYALLSPAQLAELIKKLNNTISLKMFSLTACYLKTDVTDEFNTLLENEFKKTKYSFISSIVVFGGLTESYASTYYTPASQALKYFESKNMHKIFVVKKDIYGFFYDLASNKPINFEETLNKIYGFKDEKNELIPENIPLIRFPSNEIFTPLQAPSLLVSIGSILAQTRDPNKPLTINTFFNPKKPCDLPKMILLYTQEVPFLLEIKNCDKNSFPFLISMSNTPIVRLKGLILEDFDPLESLYLLYEPAEQFRVYLIDELYIQKSSPKATQKILEKKYTKIAIVKHQSPIYNKIFFTNELNENIVLHRNKETGIIQYNPYDEYLSHFLTTEKAPLISPIQKATIEESLKKKELVRLQETFKEFSRDLLLMSLV